MYLMNTYQEYFDKNKIQLYGSVKVDIPKPELYVVICRNKNLLKDYLTERETEVEGIMLTLFNQERVFDIEKNRLLEQGREEGIARGKLFSIKYMMKNLKISAEQDMEILEIPRSDFAKYMTLL